MRNRRGSALILVLLMTLAVAGLAVAAIFMSSSAGLLTRFYDRERDYRLAAESGIALARTRLQRDTSLAVPDTGVMQLLSGYALTDASGATLPRVRVNVYAASTGDTTGLGVPMVTLIGASYDANGTRHVRRVDLRRESFSKYSLFADSFPASASHDGLTVAGPVHTNSRWVSSGTPAPIYNDSVTAVNGLSGTGDFRGTVDSSVTPVPYPKDSTYAWMHGLATGADLDVTPTAAGSRMQFVALDADADGTIESHEGFVRVFDLAYAMDTMRLRAAPTVHTDPYCASALFFCAGQSTTYYKWDDDIVQNQCGAFYFRSNRWHFFPIASHRAAWAKAVIQATGSPNYPAVNPARMDVLDDYDFEAVQTLAENIETMRCFPAGSPFLMATERFTNESGQVTGGIADTIPFGVVTPSGGWPVGGAYGGSDTTFTPRSRTCRIASGSTGRCVAATLRELGTWRAFGGDQMDAIPATVRQAAELPYLWPFDPALNPSSRRVLSASSGPVRVSGEVRGRVTLRVAGAVTLVDRLRYHTDPNAPEQAACEDQVGVVATADVLVVSGLTSRARRVGWQRQTILGQNYLSSNTTAAFGSEPRFTLHGNLMSLGGTVGAEAPGEIMGESPAGQLHCPDIGSGGQRWNGGCLFLTGSAASRVYTATHSATAQTGFQLRVMTDRCRTTDQRPPYFPLTNRYTLVRTLEIEPSQANTPAKVRALLMRLKGRTL